MNKEQNTISLKIKELRKSKGLTQKQLAAAINVSYSAIVGYENGRREPNSKAMAALESFFHVTGDYLRGQKNESDVQFIWQDQEAMAAVKESFPTLINNLLDSILHGTEAEQKMLFDILVEIYHISSIKSISPEHRTAAFLLIEDIFTRTTRFIDFCNRLSINSEEENNRIEKYKQSCIEDYQKALSDFQDSINNSL